MIEQFIEMAKAFIENDEVFDVMAQGYMKMVKALIANGFTMEQAMQIVASQGIGINVS